MNNNHDEFIKDLSIDRAKEMVDAIHTYCRRRRWNHMCRMSVYACTARSHAIKHSSVDRNSHISSLVSSIHVDYSLHISFMRFILYCDFVITIK